MKIEITEKGSVQFDVTEFVDSMSPETKADLCRSLVADELLFQAVADYIVTGQYHDGWWASDGAKKLRERFLPLMPEAARELVRDLVQERDRYEADAKRSWDDYWRLWHAWPREHTRDRPEKSKWAPTWKPDEKEAQAMIDAKAAEVSK
jgi:hypothetical protein